MRTRLQLDADSRSARVRRNLAEDLHRFREDAGLTRVAVATAAGIDASTITKVEAGVLQPTLETYMRIAAALGLDFSARTYPNAGPPIHDRHQIPMVEAVLGARHARWQPSPEVRVQQPARGWVDLALHDPQARVLVAAELESLLRRIEQLLRWSGEKADSLPSAAQWPTWARRGDPEVHRLLVVRWTRDNRDAAAAARRQLREAYPADPRDALDSLTGTAAWPGSAMLWARLDGPTPRLEPGP
jgi:transcriptional regulator with XRE-family HTH domain